MHRESTHGKIAVAEMKMHPPYFVMPIFGFFGVCGHLLTTGSFLLRSAALTVRQKGMQMKINILYAENISNDHGQYYPHYTSLEVPEGCDITAIIDDANKLKFAITKAKLNPGKGEDPATFVPKTREEMFVPCENLQDAVDVWNDYEFNGNRRFYRRLDSSPKVKHLNGKCGTVSTDDGNAYDNADTYMEGVADYRSGDEVEEDFIRIDTINLLRRLFPEETVEMMVAVFIDGLSVREYAKLFCDDPKDSAELARAENSISHRLNRAKEKFKKIFPTPSDFDLSAGYRV